MLRKYEGIKNHVEALAEEGEGASLPETNKREQSTETKEAVRTIANERRNIMEWNYRRDFRRWKNIQENRSKEQMIPIYMFSFWERRTVQTDVEGIPVVTT